MTEITFGRIRKTGKESRAVDIKYGDKKIGEFCKPSKYKWWEVHFFARPSQYPCRHMRLAEGKNSIQHYSKWHIRDHLEGILDYTGKRIKYEY